MDPVVATEGYNHAAVKALLGLNSLGLKIKRRRESRERECHKGAECEIQDTCTYIIPVRLYIKFGGCTFQRVDGTLHLKNFLYTHSLTAGLSSAEQISLYSR